MERESVTPPAGAPLTWLVSDVVLKEKQILKFIFTTGEPRRPSAPVQRDSVTPPAGAPLT
jgi:hypothetical protein